MVGQDDSRLRFMPKSDILKASGHVFVYRDRWWIIHPENGLVFYQTNPKKKDIESSSPQCNSSENMSKLLADRLYTWASIEFIPMVLVPINLRDYQD